MKRMEQLDTMLEVFSPENLLNSLVKTMSNAEANDFFKTIAKVEGLPLAFQDYFR